MIKTEIIPKPLSTCLPLPTLKLRSRTAGLGGCEIGKLSGYKYVIFQSPLYGALTIREQGYIEYKAMKGYKGEDRVEITVYDGISEFKTFTVKITVIE